MSNCHDLPPPEMNPCKMVGMKIVMNSEDSEKRYTAEQVRMKLREIDVMTGQGEAVTIACRQAGLKSPAKQKKRAVFGLTTAPASDIGLSM